ncbi:Fis family transcriptional regulator [Shewanella sp. NFH-SH190041]|uniref:response regulator n=1 Tax=Shewanella sp. NFH-SH190041 TaxID=2950245 RepID=UPI0021C26CE1|nr:response regulator [Shewanella sp. NFH-SH190041]BDM63940.1 Fis family transcriptional regulator [Shewanella sp. NFH-SH190041]
MTHSILIVDDNSISRENLQLLLNPSEWQVTLAENGIQALQLCEQHQYSAIITGFFMPIIDGPHLVGLLRDKPQYQHTPIIMLSTRSEQEVSASMDMTQLAFFMRKPLSDELKRQLLADLTAVVVATEGKAA